MHTGYWLVSGWGSLVATSHLSQGFGMICQGLRPRHPLRANYHDLGEITGFIAILGRSTVQKSVIRNGKTQEILQLSELGRILFNLLRVSDAKGSSLHRNKQVLGLNFWLGYQKTVGADLGARRWYYVGGEVPLGC